MPRARRKEKSTKRSDLNDINVVDKDNIYLDQVSGIDPEIVGGDDNSVKNERNNDEHGDVDDVIDDNTNQQATDFSVLSHDSHPDNGDQFTNTYTNQPTDDPNLLARYQAQTQYPNNVSEAAAQAAATAEAAAYMQLASAAAAAQQQNPIDNVSNESNNGQPPHTMVSFLSTERLSNTASVGKRRVRLGWSKQETDYLMDGCKVHGVGNWKKILNDPNYQFNCRNAVDLKDRFRTSFPEEYSRLYPNAKTHKVKRPRTHSTVMAEEVGDYKPDPLLVPPNLVKINRKERRSFTKEEDQRLLEGFNRHGPAWSKIQRDTSLQFYERRSTDLRDRFRNAFPEKYTQAGYKGRNGEGPGRRGHQGAAIQAAADAIRAANQATANQGNNNGGANPGGNNSNAVTVANVAAQAVANLPIQLHDDATNGNANDAQLLNQRYSLTQPNIIIQQHGNNGQNFNTNFQNTMYYSQPGLSANIPQLYRATKGNQGSN